MTRSANNADVSQVSQAFALAWTDAWTAGTRTNKGTRRGIPGIPCIFYVQEKIKDKGITKNIPPCPAT